MQESTPKRSKRPHTQSDQNEEVRPLVGNKVTASVGITKGAMSLLKNNEAPILAASAEMHELPSPVEGIEIVSGEGDLIN